uniref:Hydrin 1', VASOTOCINYL-GLY-LYS n=3 Tax=Euteleostomi TaxID=117571 RepID=Q9PS22_XENLA|nr:hydrin 1', vasotocinyl-Gly-Lys [Xenopus laevis, pituitary glands, Peptide, 11 aa] [Xenopus laevis]
CYIQNCPRGGK